MLLHSIKDPHHVHWKSDAWGSKGGEGIALEPSMSLADKTAGESIPVQVQ